MTSIFIGLGLPAELLMIGAFAIRVMFQQACSNVSVLFRAEFTASAHHAYWQAAIKRG